MPEDSNVPARFPSQITVYCDACGGEHSGDYVVSEEDIAEVRFGYARKHLSENEGWQCDELGDFCPKCKTSKSYFQPGDFVRNKRSGSIFQVAGLDEWNPRYYETFIPKPDRVFLISNLYEEGKD